MTNLVSPAPFTKSLPRLCRTLLLLLFCSLAGTPAWADDRTAARLFAQDFYKAYAAAADPGKFVAKSDKITPEFKKAYAAYMKKDADSDPIIAGQDTPAKGYVAEAVELDGTKATVTLKPRDKGFSMLKVHVIWNGKTWLLNGVNGLKGK